MAADSQTSRALYTPEELLCRPLEPQHALAIDPPGSTEVDDAIRVDFFDKDEAYATVYVADGAFVAREYDVLAQAIRKGFSRYEHTPYDLLLPDFILRQLGLDATVPTGVPTVAVRMHITPEQTSLIGIDRVRTHVRCITYADFVDERQQGNPDAQDIAAVARILRGQFGYGKPCHDERGSYQTVAGFMITTNNLVAQHMQQNELPWMYRHYKETPPGASQAEHAVYDHRPLPHEGLRVTPYCHFTSPLRRAADLVCHINLEAVLGQARPEYGPKSIGQIASHLGAISRGNAFAEAAA